MPLKPVTPREVLLVAQMETRERLRHRDAARVRWALDLTPYMTAEEVDALYDMVENAMESGEA